MSEIWEYRHLEVRTGDMEGLELRLNALGSVGWEMCGFASVDKTIGFNGYTAILKRRCASLPPPSSAQPAWWPDPAERHEIRYWDGLRWTEHVRDGDTDDRDMPIPSSAP